MVDYTLTPNKSLVKPNRGTYVDTWDTPINNDWDYVDRALGGTYTVPTTTGTITLSNDQARYQQIKLPNTTEVRTIELPLIEGSSTVAVGGFWIIDNASSTQDVFVTTLAPGTNTITVRAGRRQSIFSNGAGVYFCDDSRIVAGAGLSLLGNTLSLTSPVTASLGGTGYAGGFNSGQLLIGKADGTLARATLTAGPNISITNGDGSITITSTASGGTSGLTSVGFSSTTGLSFTPSTVTTTSPSTTLGGTLLVGNGGTGTTSFGGGGFVKSPGTTAALTVATTVSLNSEVSGNLPVANGGTGATSVTGTGSNVLNGSPAFTGTASFATISASGNISSSGTVSGGALSSSGAISASGNITGQNFVYSTASSTYTTIGAGPAFDCYVSGIRTFSAATTNFAVAKDLACIGTGAVTTNLTGSWAIYSDIRTKKDVTPYSKSLEAIKTLSPVTYKYNGQYGVPDDNVVRTGLIAQDVLNSAMPEMVLPRQYKDGKTGQTTEVYQLDTSSLIFALINSIKELDARVKALEAKVGP